MIHVYKKQHCTRPFRLNIINFKKTQQKQIKQSHDCNYDYSKQCIFQTNRIYFERYEHVNDNPTIYQSYDPQNGLEKK